MTKLEYENGENGKSWSCSAVKRPSVNLSQPGADSLESLGHHFDPLRRTYLLDDKWDARSNIRWAQMRVQDQYAKVEEYSITLLHT
jgi:hypothetical protein